MDGVGYTNTDEANEKDAAELKAGDEAAFRRVMDRYLPIITHFAWRILDDRGEAEDVAEETFIKLWQGRDRIEGFASVKAFLFIAARNACLNALRRERNMLRREHRYAAEVALGDSDTMDYEILRAELIAEIQHAAGELPERIGQVFRLGYLEGLSNRAIASRLGITVGTVKKQKARAIELLRERLKGDRLLVLLLALAELGEKINS